jgi:hypothetical protein
MRIIVKAALMLAAIATVASAQTTITGRVVADDTGDPIANARVTLTSTALGTPVVLTDGEGRFSFPAPPAKSNVVANKTGYSRGEATPADSNKPIELRLKRGAAISGTVVDEFAEPVANVQVGVETPGTSKPNARDFFAPAADRDPPPVATTVTDDRGEYRVAGLSAGTFAVAVTVIDRVAQSTTLPNGQVVYMPAIRKMYYPGVDARDRAEGLRLQPGDDQARIDFVVPAEALPILQLRPAAPGEPPRNVAPGTGVIRGRVSTTDGRPLSHAQMMLIPQTAGAQPQVARTGDDGRFEFLELAAATFRVAATKQGYSGRDGVGFSGVASVEVTAGATRENVDITLSRFGTVSGRVLDELGDPMQGVSVQPLAVRYEAGRRRLVPAGAAPRVTDDLGRYRLFGLPPGQYIVSASGTSLSTELPGYARSYYPGTANTTSAQFVPVGLAQDVPGIDLAMSRTQTARAAGRIFNSSGQAGVSGSLQLIPARSTGGVTSVGVGARILPDGSFEFPNVSLGQYVIQAYRGRSNSWTEGEFGSLRVSLTGDVKDLVLQTSAGSSIKGRFTFDTSDRTKLPARSAIALSPIPVDYDLSPSNNLANADIHDDWTFEMAGVNGPRRLQLLRVPAGWMLKEIRASGIDVTDRALPFGTKEQSLADVEIVLTDRISQVAGTITDERGRPVTGASVVVFATDRERWYEASRYLQIAAVKADGTFMIAGLPFGSYYAVPLAELPAGGGDAWQDPDFLASLIPRASTLTVGLGQTAAVNLRLPAR